MIVLGIKPTVSKAEEDSTILRRIDLLNRKRVDATLDLDKALNDLNLIGAGIRGLHEQTRNADLSVIIDALNDIQRNVLNAKANLVISEKDLI